MAGSAFALAQLGAVTIPITMLTMQQTCATPFNPATIELVTGVVVGWLTSETANWTAKQYGVDVSIFLDKVKKTMNTLATTNSQAISVKKKELLYFKRVVPFNMFFISFKLQKLDSNLV